MIARVATRGGSFTGAGMYYLHDKRKEGEARRTTTERVAWTETHNLPTNDPEKAMKWMAYTSMNADMLKEQSGVSRCGRKATAGSVYSFSLAWHPEQKPQKEEMLSASYATLEKLGLVEHQAVFVAHQETDHKHVHVICNLVHPETGKTARISHDRLALSDWAEQYEKEQGKIYCEQRVENNQQRRELTKEPVKEQHQQDQGQPKDAQRTEKPQSRIVKHREKRLERASIIQGLYTQSDSGRAFSAALEEQGYTLAKGDRRGFVIVDKDGEIHSLSRQLEGQRAKDIKARLSDLESVGNAKEIAEERKHFDRDADEVEKQNKLLDAATEFAKKADADRSTQADQPTKAKRKVVQKDSVKDDQHLDQVGDVEKSTSSVLDRLRAYQNNRYESLADLYEPHIRWSETVNDERRRFEKHLTETYNRQGHLDKIVELEKALNKSNTLLGKASGKHKSFKDELEAERKTLASLDIRMEEARSAHETKLLERYPEPDINQLEQERREADRLAALDKLRSSKDTQNQPQPLKDEFDKSTPQERDGLDFER